MLKSLDIVIGLAVIMLALSMSVTIITQFVTTILNSRGRHLRRGLADLIGQLDPELRRAVADRGASHAKAIATAVLRHPLISASASRLGSVVHREELIKLLMDFATDSSTLKDDTRRVLTGALQRNGIADPAATLRSVRDAAQELEAAHPTMAAHIRQTTAILEKARSDFTGKINSWFDQTIDRVAQRFTASTRAITFGASLIVAVTLQADAIALVNRLAADDRLRQAFVEQAIASNPSPQRQDDAIAGYNKFVMQTGLIAFPNSYGAWQAGWTSGGTVAGVLLTSLLLSLGAPFWYNALSQLLQLRSVIAKKDDEQRESRQMNAPSTPPKTG